MVQNMAETWPKWSKHGRNIAKMVRNMAKMVQIMGKMIQNMATGLLKGTFSPQPSQWMSKGVECPVVLNFKQCSLSHASQIAAQCLGAQCPGAGCPGAHCLGAQCP